MIIIAFRHSSAPAILLKDGCAVAKQQLHDIWETFLLRRPSCRSQPHRTRRTSTCIDVLGYGTLDVDDIEVALGLSWVVMIR